MRRSSAFNFQQFSIKQDHCAMKVGIDSVLLGAWSPITQAHNILDIGTGTGILALMMAQRSEAKIDAVEIDSAAFLQAQDNIKNSTFHDRIHCHNSSIQDFKSQLSYNLIISNPPYFEDSLQSDDKTRNIARHNDSLNLDDLCAKAAQLLASKGTFAIILPYSSLEKIKITANHHQLHLSHITEIKGKEHKPPNRVLICMQKEETTTLGDTLTVYSERGRYTKEFQELTQDFYLPSIFR